MVAVVRDLLEALSSTGITIEARNGRLRYRPRSALTTEMLAAVKSCKQDLLEILTPDSLLPGLSGSGSRSDGAASVAQVHHTTSSNKVDTEFDRFARVAKAMPGGGLYDPINGAPTMPSGYVPPSSERPAGVPRGWTARSWIGHLRYMGNACAALNPEQSADYLSKAEQLEDHCNV